ncbi:DUF1353 domain-containing protein [Epibacterium ulvae]|uniref:DUF1353 domain-containing protein n=1 Tax=Epibacterium ulvae TaxID=1156985 RepID=UPI0024921178|nr:DUF1353 domain-containing protein [Epibacterium ulvae]
MLGQRLDWCERRGATKYLSTKWVNAFGLSVPPGVLFEADIPWWARCWISPHDPAVLLAALLHDYALHVLQHGRVRAAAPFSEALRAGGLGRTKRLVMVLGVIARRYR